MSLSPESFDRLLAHKLAQAPAPPYEPAHWDQLEDQLQHLNQALQQASASPQAAAGASGVAPAPVVGKLAAIGISALLTGLTAVNGYFFYATTEARTAATAAPAPVVAVAPAPEPSAPAVAEAAPDAVVAVPTPAAASPADRRRTIVAAAPQATPGVPDAPVGAPEPASAPLAADVPQVAPVVSAAPAAMAPATSQPAESVAGRPDTLAQSRTPEPAEPQNAIVIHNVVTPNGDGLNDRFELPFAAGTCRLTIYDRHDRLVYSAEQYQNNWDGGALPTGSYIYHIKPAGQERPLVGSLRIIR